MYCKGIMQGLGRYMSLFPTKRFGTDLPGCTHLIKPMFDGVDSLRLHLRHALPG